MTAMLPAPPPTRAVRVPGPDTAWYRRRLGLTLARIGVGVVLVGIWWLASALDWLPDTLLPSPLDVLITFLTLTTEGEFWLALLTTLGNGMAALGLAILVGIPLGLLLGLLPWVERMTRFLLDLGRSFPVIALLPVMILLMGTNGRMEVTVVFLGVLWPVLLQTIYGSRRLDPVVGDTTRVYRLNLWIRFVKVLLPAASPFIMTGIRIASSVAILVAMAVELLGRTPGLGLELSDAQIDDRPDYALGYLFWAGFLGLGLNYLFQFAEDRILVWNARGDQGGAQ